MVFWAVFSVRQALVAWRRARFGARQRRGGSPVRQQSKLDIGGKIAVRAARTIRNTGKTQVSRSCRDTGASGGAGVQTSVQGGKMRRQGMDGGAGRNGERRHVQRFVGDDRREFGRFPVIGRRCWWIFPRDFKRNGANWWFDGRAEGFPVYERGRRVVNVGKQRTNHIRRHGSVGQGAARFAGSSLCPVGDDAQQTPRFPNRVLIGDRGICGFGKRSIFPLGSLGGREQIRVACCQGGGASQRAIS